MKHFAAIFFLISTLNFVEAQKQDYQWLFGYDNEYAMPDTNFGGVTVNFNDLVPAASSHHRIADFLNDNISYCDSNGKLLFYSNGDDVFDGRDSVMLGGDSINYSYFWIDEIYDEHYRFGGLNIVQGMLALPDPSKPMQVYLCHYTVEFEVDSSGVPSDFCDTSFYSLIDLSGNGGLGEVIIKNKIVNTDSLAYSAFSATQHGNGRDWWVLHPYCSGSPCYYEFLLTDTGFGLYNIQCLGDGQFSNGALAMSCFSPDGSKYFWSDAVDGIHMLDFDRCTGELSNPQIIPFPVVGFGDSVTLASGVAVSPNNRYLYVACNYLVLQYDLLANDIGASVDTVGLWNYVYDPQPPYAANFFMEQLGPDGKIYINSTSVIITKLIN